MVPKPGMPSTFREPMADPAAVVQSSHITAMGQVGVCIMMVAPYLSLPKRQVEES